MDYSKVSIGLLEGKSNWQTWKFKISIMLRGVTGAMDVVEGILSRPATLEVGATVEEQTAYNNNLTNFMKADNNALLLITTNMKEDILQNVMRFNTSKEVWDELHRLYDGVSEDKAYDLCLQFFSYKRLPADDIASHLSKLKNLWSSLKLEISKDSKYNCELPELLLICKILGTLSEEYFSFRSSWLLMAKSERTIENLTNQLCAYEKTLSLKGDDCSSQEVLLVKSTKPKFRHFGKTNTSSNINIVCHYCKKFGHKIKNCLKWKADGKPPKPKTTQNDANMALMSVSTEILSTDCNENSWYVDNGATNHVTNRKDLFQTFEPFLESHKVITANGSVEALGKGTIEVEANVNGKWERLLLTEVWYVPDIQKNLFSMLSAQDKNPNSIFTSTSETCKLKIDKKVKLIGVRNRDGGLFKLALKNIVPDKVLSDVNVVAKENLLQLYHERFGHQNKRYVKSKIQQEFGINEKLNNELCKGCIYGKAHRLKFGTRERATKPGELMHTDVCGPFLHSQRGYRYYVLFKDDYTRYKYVYFIKKKSEVPEKTKQMIAEVKVSGHVIQELLSDNSGEFDNEALREILNKNGIKQRLVMPYTPEQNGCCERENRTIVETARTMMHAHENLPQGLWAEMINSAAYILNRTGPSSVEGKSPQELWTGKKPNLKHLRIIGCTCYAHIPKINRKKMDKKAVKGFLIGYDNDDGYRIWCKENHRLIRSRDVIFHEELLPEKRIVEEPYLKDEGDPLPFIEDEEKSETTDEEDIHESNFEERQLRDRSNIRQPQRFNDYVMSTVSSITSLNEPISYEEAMKSSEKDEWLKAMQNEMDSLKENETWTLVDLPKGKKPIGCRWVYKVKTTSDGSIERHKARLVVKGFSQKPGVDYDQTFSPVAKMATIRSLLSVAASENMSLMQFDVSTAFLYGELDENIFMRQPEGFEDGTNRVCHLKRSLYGLKQAPRCWNKRFAEYLLKLGFKRSDSDPCLFIQRKNSELLLLVLYVDDGLVAATNKIQLEELIRKLKEEFKVTNKPASYYLGFEIGYQKDGSIKVSQAAYTNKILDRFGMSQCKPVVTPIIKGAQSGKVEKAEKSFPYRQAVGALMYLMTGTRPDIAFAVGVASRSLENPTESDWLGVKRIFRYLKGTACQGLTYKQGYKKDTLECYSDADHGGDDTTGRSTSGVICMYAGGAISWLSQRQSSVAISTTEAEIVAASEAAREIVWLKRLLEEIINVSILPELQVDNEAAIRLAQNPEYHRRTKHIKTRHFFVRELVTAGDIEVKRVPTEFQIADIMTKPLHKPRLLILCNSMGLY